MLHVRPRSLAAVAVSLASLTSASPAFSDGSNDKKPPEPVLVTGARSVETRNESGGLTRQTGIPSGSSFATYGGARSSTCEFTADVDGVSADGSAFVAGQVVISTKWVFREVPSSFSPEPSLGDNTMHGESKGPLADAVRYFAVYCDTRFHLIRASIPVPVSDPMLDPRPTAADLYNNLQLERPVVFSNPVVAIWGGVVTRYPVWLAVQPSAWRPQKSLPARFLGWTLLLLTEPTSLQFEVNFVPDPNQPSPAFSGIVECVTDPTTVVADATAFPAMPTLPEQTEPGVNGPCMWTPPGPGTVTIQARITYTVTFWANGYTEPRPDYVWTSTPTTVQSGELAAVNTNN